MSVDPLSSQKHVLFLIPNYDASNASAGVASPLSYLKLGSAESTTDLSTSKLRGDDLLTAAGVATDSYDVFFVDDQRNTACASATDSDAVGYAHGTHYDSAHAASDDLDATLSDPATTYYRSQEKDTFASAAGATAYTGASLSAQLVGDGSSVYARGGWRDHTDGNRIVTVRGDRVDLVVGNYKRVVFGRVSGFTGQGTTVGPSSYESSGGHLFERTSADVVQHYAIERVEETDIDGNTYWKLVERASNADCVFRYSGRHVEHHNGPRRATSTGADESSTAKNPEITRRHMLGTSATEIEASSLTRTTEVGTFSETTWASSASGSDTTFCVSYHRARGKAFGDGFTYKSELFCNTQISATLFGGRFHYTGGVAKFDDFVGGYQVSSGVRLNAHAGARIRVHYGTRSRWYAGLWWRATVGPSAIVDVGVYTKMYILQFYKAPPVDTVYFLGDAQFNFSRTDSDVMKSAAFGIFMES